MCGIIGVAGWVGHREKQVFTNLLGWDIVRGHHATGVAAVRAKTNEVHVLKRAMHAYDFMDLKMYEGTIDNSRVLIGHNRYGTVGGNSHRNAHPFVFDKVVGVHNGTIPYQDRKVLKDNDKFDTDSEALYFNIDQFGVKNALKDLKGAWSLVWWDREEHKLRFLRNKERPMFYTFSETKKELFWASESGMLQAVLARHNVKHGPVYGTPEDVMLSFTIPTDNAVIDNPERTEVKGALPFVFRDHRAYHQEGWDEFEEFPRRGHHNREPLPNVGTGDRRYLADTRSTAQGSSSLSTPLAVRPSEKLKDEVLSEIQKPAPGAMSELAEAVKERLEKDASQSEIPFTPGHVSESKSKGEIVEFTGQTSRLVKGYGGFYIAKVEFDKATKNGCAYCEKNVQFSDIMHNKYAVHWLKHDAFLCTECYDDSDIRAYLSEMNVDIPSKAKMN